MIYRKLFVDDDLAKRLKKGKGIYYNIDQVDYLYKQKPATKLLMTAIQDCLSDLKLLWTMPTGWKQKGAGYCRVDAPSGNEECGTSLTLKRMLEKQKTWRQALNLQQNCLSGTRVFCCKFCF